jgi:hypothetical protein
VVNDDRTRAKASTIGFEGSGCCEGEGIGSAAEGHENEASIGCHELVDVCANRASSIRHRWSESGPTIMHTFTLPFGLGRSHKVR